jgi:hypothetical protein
VRWAGRAALALLFLVAGRVTFAAAPGPADTVAEVAVWRDGDALRVMEVVMAPKGGLFAWLPGAYDIGVPPGASAVIERQGFRPPARARVAEVQYRLPLPPGNGAVTKLAFPTGVDAFFFLAGPGVTLPIVLNQRFFDQGTTVQNGIRYHAYGAGRIPAGTVLPLRFLVTPTPTAGLWLWALPVVALAVYLLVLRRRRHA